MDKSEAVTKQSSLSRKDAEAALDALNSSIKTPTKEKMVHVGFGEFGLQQKKPKKRIHQQAENVVDTPRTNFAGLEGDEEGKNNTGNSS